jgi:nickel superoxide dismutase
VIRERIVAAVRPHHTLHAHCDVPCGIYDPHGAELGARTVARMVELINENLGDDVAQRNKFVRCVSVKEEHAELVKREVQVIWSDYFKPEHLDTYPQLHDLTWRILKQAGKCKQSVDAGAAAELQALVKQFADIFWETKGGRPQA